MLSINLASAIKTKAQGLNFYVLMALGLVFSMLGDVFIAFHFVAGTASFAVGHIFFVVAYSTLQNVKALDLLASGVLFLTGLLFLLFFPHLSFDVPVFRIVCIVYALIISAMFGKSFLTFHKTKTPFTES